jgi:hypothetical protein
VAKRRAIGGDVVGDELAEEWPDGGRGSVGTRVIGVIEADVAGPARAPKPVQRALVDSQRRKLVEQASVATAIDRGIDAFGRKAVVASGRHRLG